MPQSYKTWLGKRPSTTANAATWKKTVRDKKPPSLRPEGWGLEGSRVTDANRLSYPTAGFEVVPGLGGTKWARPRTEFTGIDPELRGLVTSFDTRTTQNADHIKRVYAALGAQLTTDAAASGARLGGLADLAGRAAPMLFQSAPVAAPGGGEVAGGVPLTVGVDQDAQATRQRQLLREAALNVNTANLDAQQAPQIGAQEIAKFTGERAGTRAEMLKALLFQTRSDALEARGQRLDFLSKQAGLEADTGIADAKLELEAAKLRQQREIARMNEEGRNNRFIPPVPAGSEAATKKKAAYNTARQKFATDVFKMMRLTPAVPVTREFAGSPEKPGLPAAEAFRQALASGLSPRDAVNAIRATTEGAKFLTNPVADKTLNADLASVMSILTQRYGATRAERILKRVFGYSFAVPRHRGNNPRGGP